MRIALLHYTAPPVAGGVERVLMDHARLFAGHGHEVTIVCGEGEGSGVVGLEVRVFPELRGGRGGALSRETAGQLEELLLEQEIVFLHNVLTMPFHGGLTEALWPMAGKPRSSLDGRPRFVSWIHDVAAANPAYAPVPDLLRRAHERVEYVAVSEVRRREWCAVSGLPGARCRVIPNGVDLLERLRLTPAVRRLAEEWRILEREVVVLHPARLLQRKNVELSLRVTAALLVAPQRSGSERRAGLGWVAQASRLFGSASRRVVDRMRGFRAIAGTCVWWAAGRDARRDRRDACATQAPASSDQQPAPPLAACEPPAAPTPGRPTGPWLQPCTAAPQQDPSPPLPPSHPPPLPPPPPAAPPPPAIPTPLLLITGAADPHHAPSAAYAASLRQLRSELHLEAHACFVSDYFSPTDADVDSLYALADALLYPSHQEGFGLPILEAALHRLPIFCRDLETLGALLPPPAVTVFPDDAAPAEIAAELRRQVEASRTIRNRKTVVQTYGWPAIYHNFLAPLLAGAETPPSP